MGEEDETLIVSVAPPPASPSPEMCVDDAEDLHDSEGQEGECSPEDVELLLTPAPLMTPAPLLSPGSPVSGSPGCAGDEDVPANPTDVNGQTMPALAEEDEPLLPWARPRWGNTTVPDPSPSPSVAEDSPSIIMEESELEIASSSDDGAVEDDGNACEGGSL